MGKLLIAVEHFKLFIETNFRQAVLSRMFLMINKAFWTHFDVQ